jgi:hypothetical protein
VFYAIAKWVHICVYRRLSSNVRCARFYRASTGKISLRSSLPHEPSTSSAPPATLLTALVLHTKTITAITQIHYSIPAAHRLGPDRRSARGLRARQPSTITAAAVSFDDIPRSGLNGKALMFPPKKDFPTRAEVLSSIPEDCFKKDTGKSMFYAAISTLMTFGCGVLGYLYIPLSLNFWPVWLAYAAVTGTIATGCWVVAHECGHNAFSDNRFIQDLVGYTLHSLLLVPYFSWQRSHAVHHSRTNHLTEGETHVPYIKGERKGTLNLNLHDSIGEGPFAFVQLFAHLIFGWPAYLLTGATGGSARGITNHFLPMINSGPVELFPGSWKNKVWWSDVGVAGVCVVLASLLSQVGLSTVAALYFGTSFLLSLFQYFAFFTRILVILKIEYLFPITNKHFFQVPICLSTSGSCSTRGYSIPTQMCPIWLLVSGLISRGHFLQSTVHMVLCLTSCIIASVARMWHTMLNVLSLTITHSKRLTRLRLNFLVCISTTQPP